MCDSHTMIQAPDLQMTDQLTRNIWMLPQHPDWMIQWGLLVMNVIYLWIDDGDTEYGERFREFVNPYIDGFEGDVMTMAGMIYLG